MFVVWCPGGSSALGGGRRGGAPHAAASSPLLTVQTQSETNSLIVKAPVNLLDEVEALIHQLDEATVTRARRVTLIPLRRSSSRRILETLGRIVD